MAKWINHVAIAAPRNTLATHTVNPASDTPVAGANFTPTAGRLLLVIIGGAVTTYGISAGPPAVPPSGWTMPTAMDAVSSTGHYGWWRTAAGGDTLTVTHNASNFPVGFVFFEFEAGSSFFGTGNRATDVASSGASPQITGLTGTKLVMASKNQSRNPGATGTFSWNAPNVEVVDFEAVHASINDGYGMSIGYQEDYVSATYQPTCTATHGNTCEALTWALDVVAPSAPSAPAVVISRSRTI